MGIFDNLKRYVRGEDYEEDELLEEEPAEESTQRWRRSDPVEREDTTVRTARTSYERPRSTAGEVRPTASGKVVSINTMTQLSVVLVQPERYEQAADIADHLKDKRTVVLNLEQTNREIAGLPVRRRLCQRGQDHQDRQLDLHHHALQRGDPGRHHRRAGGQRRLRFRQLIRVFPT